MKHWVALALLSLPIATAAVAQGRGDRADRGRDEPIKVRSTAGRAHDFEMGLGLVNTDNLGTVGLGGAALSVDSDTGFAIWGGYNFGNHWEVLGEMVSANPSYDATIVDDTTGAARAIHTQLDTNSVMAKGVYNILPGKMTPFIELGAGWTNLDSNIIRGQVFTSCFFDWFYGYVCSNFYDTYRDTRSTWSGSVGFRWDINANMLFRASVGQMRIDTEAPNEDLDFDTAQIAFAWKMR